MALLKYLGSFLILIGVICGCSGQSSNTCRPVLFPYVEYGYKAYTEDLSGSYTPSKNTKTIELFGVRWDLPRTWNYEKHGNWGIKFTTDDGRSFALFFKKNTPFTVDWANFNFIGCEDFKWKNQGTTRTDLDFTTALYLFSDEDLKGEPTFWQYYILWAKTKQLHDMAKIVHFKGRNLVAFQKNNDPEKLCAHNNIASQVEIYPKKIAPDSITIAADFTDDTFFTKMLEMLDAMNRQ